MTLHGPVLVGTDLSAGVEEALRQGAELAGGLSSTLFVCHVIPELLPDITLFAEFRRTHGPIEQSVLAKAREAVQEQLDAVLKTHAATLDVARVRNAPRWLAFSGGKEGRRRHRRRAWSPVLVVRLAAA
jgi:nucleotide-binding universal stress UspA family protein